MAFIRKNLHPTNKKIVDAEIRAVAAACNITWQEAFWGLTNTAFEMLNVTYDIDVIEKFLVERGFNVGKVVASKGSKRPTVKQFAEDNPDKIAVLRISGSYTACAYGNYVDTWDCGGSSVYKYFYKQI